MLTVPQVAIEATEERYRALVHEPTGTPIGSDGTARWPADSFTYRLRNEGAIRVLEEEPAAEQPAPAPADDTDPAPPLSGRSARRA